MKQISETKYRTMGELIQSGASVERIAKQTDVHKNTVLDFINGQTRNASGVRVFEEMTRPPGITKAQHEAWLAENGYRGFAGRAKNDPRRSASRSRRPT